MKTSWMLAGAIMGVVLVAGCDKGESPTTDPAQASASQAGDQAKADEAKKGDTDPASDRGTKTVADAKKMLAKLLEEGTDQKGFLRDMRPKDEDLKAIFADDMFDKAKAYYEKMFSEEGSGSLTKEGQTELLVWAATSEELKAGTGDAGKFPGGYKNVADKLKPGLTFFRFKIVKPGETLGMAFDGLTYVNGRWVVVPKPWKAK